MYAFGVLRICQQAVQFSHSVVSDSLQPCGLQHARLPCPSPTPRACSDSYPWAKSCPYFSPGEALITITPSSQLERLYSDSLVQSLSRVRHLRPHGLQHARLPCPLPTPGACSNSCPSSQWCSPKPGLILGSITEQGIRVSKGFQLLEKQK